MPSDLLVAVCGRKALYKRQDGTYYAKTTVEAGDPASLHGTGEVRKTTELGSDRQAALNRLYGWE